MIALIHCDTGRSPEAMCVQLESRAMLDEMEVRVQQLDQECLFKNPREDIVCFPALRPSFLP